MLVAIYNQDNGQVAFLSPTLQVLEQLGGGREAMMKIAIKDVPAGKRFAIIDAADLPQDVPQERWVVDEADLTDGVGGESNEFTDEQLLSLHNGGVL